MKGWCVWMRRPETAEIRRSLRKIRPPTSMLAMAEGVAITTEAQNSLDSGVGFGNAPESAKLKAAEQNVGVATVAGAWAYQGSRAAYSKGQMLNAQGRNLNSINAENGRANWQAEITGARVNANAQEFSPPALGRDYMYLSSAWGHLVSVLQQRWQRGI